MRKILFTLSLLIALSAGAQNYIKEGTTWSVAFWHPLLPDHTPKEYVERLERCMDGDEECLGLFVKGVEATEFMFQYFVKTEGDKVFFKNPVIYPDQWYLMYDFNPAEKEIIEVYSPYRNVFPSDVGDPDAQPETDDAPYEPSPTRVTAYVGEWSGTTPSLDIMYLCDVNRYPQINDAILNPYCDIKSYPDLFEGRWIAGIGSYNGFSLSAYIYPTSGNRLIEVICDGERVYYNEDADCRLAGVDATESASPSVRTEGCDLVVTAVESGKPVSVYAADGRLIHSSVTSADEQRLTLPAKGIYLVRIGNHSEKVIAL